MKTKSMIITVTLAVLVILAGYWWFNNFGSGGNVEQVQTELRTIAAGAQDYYLKPRMIGGGGKSFEGISFEQIRLQGAERSSDNLRLATKAAEYTIEDIEPENLLISAVLKSGRNNSFIAEIGPDSLLIREN